MISARKNRPLFFSKPKLVQNIGLCGNSRLPAAQLRKPHDKANLKREESVCLLKVSQGKRVGFLEFFFLFRTTSLSLGGIPVGSRNPKRQVWAVSSQFPPPLMPHSSFLSSSCQWLLWTIRGWLSQRLRPQHLNLWPGSSNSRAVRPRNKTLLKSRPEFCYLFITDRLVRPLSACLWFNTTTELNNSKLTALTGLINVRNKMLSVRSLLNVQGLPTNVNSIAKIVFLGIPKKIVGINSLDDWLLVGVT